MVRLLDRARSLTFVLAAVCCAAAVGCGNGGTAGAACEADADCPGDQQCLSGQCVAPWTAGDGASVADASGNPDVVGADTDLPLPTPDAATPDTAAPPDTTPGRPDTAAPDTSGSGDTVTADTSVPADTRDGGGTNDSDVAPDTGTRRPLSCNEFYKCSNYLCDPYDYQCHGKYQMRLSTSEQDDRRKFEQCIRDRCQGKRDQEWHQCVVAKCGKTWTACYTHPNGKSALSCSEFQACANACSGADNPSSCRRDCQTRATSQAQNRLGDYHRCFNNNCSGKEGTAAVTCIRKHCKSEFRTCFGC